MLLTPSTTSEPSHELDALLRDRLSRVERCFSEELASDLDCVNDLAGHVERYRGKMLRPMLAVLSSLALGEQSDAGPASQQRCIVLATVFEMVHMSTLVHDDVLDEADVRRRGRTVNALHGNEAAVMLGDYLISHAYHLCCSLGDPVLARAVAATTNTVCEGELLQLSRRHDFEIAEQTYYEIIRRKTASLCDACCRLPALLAGETIDSGHATTLGTFGEKIGIAFQIIDDVLDLVGDEETVGKSLGRDLAKGKMTLPLIRWVASLEGKQRADALSLLSAAATGENTDLLRRRVEGAGTVEQARAVASELVQDASGRLRDGLPDTPARQRLLDLAAAVLRREH